MTKACYSEFIPTEDWNTLMPIPVAAPAFYTLQILATIKDLFLQAMRVIQLFQSTEKHYEHR